MNICQIRTIIGERPSQAPAGWIVYNAPRPIYASCNPETNDYALWQGDFCAGIFYAAVDPTSPASARMVELNRQQAATILHYISEDDAFQAGRQRLIDSYVVRGQLPDMTILDDPANRTWVVNNYLNFLNGR